MQIHPQCPVFVSLYNVLLLPDLGVWGVVILRYWWFIGDVHYTCRPILSSMFHRSQSVAQSDDVGKTCNVINSVHSVYLSYVWGSSPNKNPFVYLLSSHSLYVLHFVSVCCFSQQKCFLKRKQFCTGTSDLTGASKLLMWIMCRTMYGTTLEHFYLTLLEKVLILLFLTEEIQNEIECNPMHTLKCPVEVLGVYFSVSAHRNKQ